MKCMDVGYPVAVSSQRSRMRDRVRTTRPVARLKQGRTDWYRIAAAERDADMTKVFIYDEIGYFGVSANDFVRDLQDVSTSTIDLQVNSPGGEVFDGVAIYEALLDHPATVNVTVQSLAASAASFIVQAGDSIEIARNATMMIHDAWGLEIGNAEDMRKMADELDRVSENIADIYAQRAGGSVTQWRDAMRAETWYSADEAIEAGLADRVKPRKNDDVDDDPAPEDRWDLSVFAYAGRSNAPDPLIPARSPVDMRGISSAIREAFA